MRKLNSRSRLTRKRLGMISYDVEACGTSIWMRPKLQDFQMWKLEKGPATYLLYGVHYRRTFHFDVSFGY